MELKGVVTKFRYKSDTSAFKIAELKPESPEYGEMVILRGSIDHSNLDMSVTLSGEWVDDPKYGRQFVVNQCMRNAANDLKSVLLWLEKQKGIGPKMAENIGAVFGDKTSDIIEKNWMELTKVKRLSKVKADLIHNAWISDVLLRKVQILLIQGGIPSSEQIAKNVIYRFGDNALARISDNPYRLTQVKGIGFKTADNMAKQFGWSVQRPERIEAAASYLLQEATDEGHTFLHRAELISQIQVLASTEVEDSIQLLPEASAVEAVNAAIGRGDIVEETVTINGQSNYMCYLPYYHDLEERAAKRIATLLTLPQILPNNIDSILTKVEKDLSVILSPEQRVAVIEAITHNCSVITGKPGTGKTTVIKALIRTAEAMGLKVKIVAPTGRAAKRIQEVTGHEAKTIHRTLQYIPKTRDFVYNSENPLTCDLLVVDEASMLDLSLLVDVLEAIPDSCSVVWLGDINQLPSIGVGTVLRDLISSKKVFTTVLDKIFRQAEGSLIIQNAHRIFRGELPEFPPKGTSADSYLIPVPKTIGTYGKEIDSIEFVRKTLVSLYERIKTKLNFDPIKDVQVLMPMKVGPAGSIAFNELIQTIVNPKGQKYELSGQVFRVNDRVMQMVNNYDLDIFNGDVGFIKSVDEENKVLKIEFFDKDIEYPFSNSNDLTLSYATSVHKSQGSEFPVTILIFLGHHQVMLERSIIYTANTRAKNLAIYLSSKSAIETAVRTEKTHKRNSLLSLRIRVAMKEKSQ